MYQSRFTGPLNLRSRFYRWLAPMSPREVDACTPSQIAALLGLDELDAPEGEDHVRPAPSDPSQPGYVAPPERRDLDHSIPRSERMRIAREAEEAAQAEALEVGVAEVVIR